MKRRNRIAEFSKDETEQRMRTALLGARIAGHKPMTGMRTGKPKPSRTKSPAGETLTSTERKKLRRGDGKASDLLRREFRKKPGK